MTQRLISLGWLLLAGVLTGPLSGCISYVTVDSDPDNTKPGIHFSLPRPYLLVTPSPDGTSTYQWLYLPDSGAQYAATPHAILSTYNFDIQVQNGLLTQVGAKLDSTSVGSEVITDLAAYEAAKVKASAQANASSNGGSGSGTSGASGGGNGGINSGGGGTGGGGGGHAGGSGGAGGGGTGSGGSSGGGTGSGGGGHAGGAGGSGTGGGGAGGSGSSGGSGTGGGSGGAGGSSVSGGAGPAANGNPANSQNTKQATLVSGTAPGPVLYKVGTDGSLTPVQFCTLGTPRSCSFQQDISTAIPKDPGN